MSSARGSAFIMTSCSVKVTSMIKLFLLALLAMLSKATDPDLQTSSVLDVQTSYGNVIACDAREKNKEYARSRVLHVQSTRSKLSCLAACFRYSLCSHAVYVGGSGRSPPSCVMLGGQLRSRTTGQEFRGHTCHILTMNPCHNGGSFIRSFCHCPDGFTGARCELHKPDDCLGRWTKVYATDMNGDTTAGGKSMVSGINSLSAGGFVKVKVQLHNATLVARGTGFHTFATPFYSMQLSPTLTKKTWNAFRDVPVRQMRLLKDDSSLYTADERDGTITQAEVATEWLARMPHVPHLALAFDSSGRTLNGTVEGLLRALEEGAEVVGFPAVQVDRAKGNVMLNKFGWELGVDNVTRTFVHPPYWFHSKLCTCGRLETVRVLVTSETLHDYTPSYRVARSLYVDACWTRATSDRTGTGQNENSVAYLIAAIVNGHRVRVVVDDMALSVEQVRVVGNVVLFDTASFVEPADSESPLTQSPAAVRLVVASDGDVVECSRRLLPNWGTNRTTHRAGSLTWFVHTRRWSRIFTVTTEGEVLHGSESALLRAVSGGATVQVGLATELPRPAGAYFLLTIHALVVAQSGHVVAEAEGLWDLLTTIEVDCLSLSVLVSSLGEVRMYSYRHREEGNHTVGRNMTIDWFVDDYQPT